MNWAPPHRGKRLFAQNRVSVSLLDLARRGGILENLIVPKTWNRGTGTRLGPREDLTTHCQL